MALRQNVGELEGKTAQLERLLSQAESACSEANMQADDWKEKTQLLEEELELMGAKLREALKHAASDRYVVEKALFFIFHPISHKLKVYFPATCLQIK